MSDLKNYFMQPRSMKCGLNVYPIKIMEYEKFKKLAAKYIILNIKQLDNHRKQNKLQELQVDELYDYIILLIENNENYKRFSEWQFRYSKSKIEVKTSLKGDWDTILYFIPLSDTIYTIGSLASPIE